MIIRAIARATLTMVILGFCAHAAIAASATNIDPALRAVVNGAWRNEADKARDSYRHPEVSLTFWGLKPNMAVIEIDPGAGAWWTPIIAPYVKGGSGRYIAAWIDLGDPNSSDGARAARADFLKRFSDKTLYGDVSAVNFGTVSGVGAPDASADFVLVARAFHNWERTPGLTDRYMAEFFRVLKKGGILAVEQHRAPAGSDAAITAPTGYVPESYVIAAANKAGFKFAARSEINANAKDDRNHPFGVWTLPPTRRSAPAGHQPDPSFDRAKYDAIGESDRMTLKFVKP